MRDKRIMTCILFDVKYELPAVFLEIKNSYYFFPLLRIKKPKPLISDTLFWIILIRAEIELFFLNIFY